jgi:hypothetical protein
MVDLSGEVFCFCKFFKTFGDQFNTFSQSTQTTRSALLGLCPGYFHPCILFPSSELILNLEMLLEIAMGCVFPATLVRTCPLRSGVDYFVAFIFLGEPGVFIGKIIAGDPIRAFLGYVDKSASEKKVVRDVFKKGDSAFLSGLQNFIVR